MAFCHPLPAPVLGFLQHFSGGACKPQDAFSELLSSDVGQLLQAHVVVTAERQQQGPREWAPPFASRLTAASRVYRWIMSALTATPAAGQVLVSHTQPAGL